MQILGHRGAIIAGDIYQNSIDAFKLALKTCDGFETDACISSDGEVFLIHNDDLAKHLNTKSQKLLSGRKLSQMTAIEILNLRLINNAHIPTLDETLQLFINNPNKTLNIELKSKHVEEVVITTLTNYFKLGHITEKQIIISSFNHPVLVTIRENLPSIKIGALFEDDTQLSITLLNNPLLNKLNPEFIIIPDSTISVKNINLIQQTKAKLIVWTFTELNNFDKDKLKILVKNHAPSGFLHALIIDNPERFKIDL